MTEAELRVQVDSFYERLPEEYISNIDRCAELRLVDNRMFTDCENRYLDAAFMSCVSPAGGSIVVEFKRGALTAEMVKDCGWYRGYFQLCYEQVPNFKWFAFVAEEVREDAEVICLKTTRNNQVGVSISAFTYSQFVKRIFKSYLDWSIERVPRTQILKTAITCQSTVPYWLDDAWFDKVAEDLYATTL